jgi:hypothetical protein
MASFVRCNSCNATLLQEIAIQNYDENVVLPQYEPLDKEALVSQYSEILRMVNKIKQEVKRNKEEMNTAPDGTEEQNHGPDLAGANALAEFMEETATAARRSAEYKISDQIQRFREKMSVNVGNMLSKRTNVKKEKQKGKKQSQEVKLVTEWEDKKLSEMNLEKLDVQEQEATLIE